MITAISLIEIAAKWRKENDYVNKEGVLIIYNGEVQSWVNVLRNPEHWASGCYAILENNEIWQTIAGDEYNGALMWLRIFEPAKNSCDYPLLIIAYCLATQIGYRAC